MTNPTHEPQKYFALALDPIHVGTGGYRLGRVDLTIVREPGTNLPKIPGTSLAAPMPRCSILRNGLIALGKARAETAIAASPIARSVSPSATPKAREAVSRAWRSSRMRAWSSSRCIRWPVQFGSPARRC